MKIKVIFLTPSLLAALLQAVLATGTAHAQTAVPKIVAMPAAATAPEAYRSAFEGYQPYAEEKVTNWKAANATVDRIGGWREYAKQAQQPANTPAQTMKAGEAVRQQKP